MRDPGSISLLFLENFAFLLCLPLPKGSALAFTVTKQLTVFILDLSTNFFQ